MTGLFVHFTPLVDFFYDIFDYYTSHLSPDILIPTLSNIPMIYPSKMFGAPEAQMRKDAYCLGTLPN